jgi:hypothetical protein
MHAEAFGDHIDVVAEWHQRLQVGARENDDLAHAPVPSSGDRGLTGGESGEPAHWSMRNLLGNRVLRSA